MSDKVTSQHLSRKAVLYVRQSSPHQVARNEESRRMQYAMSDRLRALGWSEIEVIDEDLGITANGTAERAGFARMVAAVCMGEVGAVAAREVSRFARNSREWQQLIEMCRVVDTLLVDHDTVYDPRHSNDRLLLGLKGSLNEYELDLLRQRAHEARHEKALRGEFVAQLPIGFIKSTQGKIEKIPDLRVQAALQLVFTKFGELGSVRQTFAWFIEHGLHLPSGRRKRNEYEIVWRRPRFTAIYAILTNPTYAGAYVWGRTSQRTDIRNGVPRKSIRRKPREDWTVLLPNHHDGYVTWEEYEQVQKAIAKNYRSPGAVKKGNALLVGLLRCGRCGKKMQVAYTGREGKIPRYVCCRGYLDNAEPRCISFGGMKVDEYVSGEVMRVVQPASVDVALMANKRKNAQLESVLKSLERDLEAARYEANRSRKQYDLADPENRLVANELERRWNVSLQAVKEIESRIAKLRDSEAENTDLENCDFSELFADLQRVWDCPTTDSRLKKRVIGTLIEEVVVNLDEAGGEIVVVIHWRGGIHTEERLKRRRRGQCGPHTSSDIVESVRVLARVCKDEVIASALSRNGLKTGRGNHWTVERVANLRRRNKIPAHSQKRQQEEGWLTLTNAAKHVNISSDALRRASERGLIPFLHPLPIGPWIFQRDDLTTASAKRVVEDIRHRRNKGISRNPDQQTLEFPGESLDEQSDAKL